MSVTIDTVIRDDMALKSKQDKAVTFGPYEERMPKRLSRRDRHQFLMYTLKKGGRFPSQSGIYIVKIGGAITKLKKVKIVDVRMGATRSISALVDKCNNN